MEARRDGDDCQLDDLLFPEFLLAFFSVVPPQDEGREEPPHEDGQRDQIHDAGQHLPVDQLIDAAEHDPSGRHISGDDLDEPPLLQICNETQCERAP